MAIRNIPPALSSSESGIGGRASSRISYEVLWDEEPGLEEILWDFSVCRGVATEVSAASANSATVETTSGAGGRKVAMAKILVAARAAKPVAYGRVLDRGRC